MIAEVTIAEVMIAEPAISTAPADQTFYAKAGKQIFDAVAAAIGLILLAPLFLVVSLLVKLTSPGPVFYRQERIGRNGKPFQIAKFRSMFQNADQRGSSVTSAGDPRITPVGRILRTFKIDELPQLWNVLKGEMSLVGPRPEVSEYVASYSSTQRRVLTVRPGITDAATIAYRHEESLLATQANPDLHYRDVVLPDKIRMNLEYLNHISFAGDLALVLRTIGCIFASKSGTKTL